MVHVNTSHNHHIPSELSALASRATQCRIIITKRKQGCFLRKEPINEHLVKHIKIITRAYSRGHG
jgi:hypothetical protein